MINMMILMMMIIRMMIKSYRLKWFEYNFYVPGEFRAQLQAQRAPGVALRLLRHVRHQDARLQGGGRQQEHQVGLVLMSPCHMVILS